MSKVDELFDEAYKLDVVEEKPREAIELCRQALEIDPENYRVRVFLGMLLGDHGTKAEILEGRQHFVDAIKHATRASLFCTTWPEEAAIHHLGIWELGQNHNNNACLYFLIDYLVCGNESSYNHLLEILNHGEPRVSEDLEMILHRIKEEYQCVPRER